MFRIKIVDENIWWDGKNWNDEQKSARAFLTLTGVCDYATKLTKKQPNVLMELDCPNLKGRYVFGHLTGVKAEENGRQNTDGVNPSQS